MELAVHLSLEPRRKDKVRLNLPAIPALRLALLHEVCL